MTLRQISLGRSDAALSAGVRDGVLAAITGTTERDSDDPAEERRSAVHRVLERAAADSTLLGAAETQLLVKWLRTLAAEA